MGLLDDLGARVLGTPQASGGDANQMVEGVMKLLNDQGGIQGLAQLFEQHGLGETVSSWIGTGQNRPITGEQLSSVLGQGRIAELLQGVGLSADQRSTALAQLLPMFIDRLTPNGEVPTGNQLLETGLGLLKAHFGGGTGGES